MADSTNPLVLNLNKKFANGRVPEEGDFQALIDLADASRKFVGLETTDASPLPGLKKDEGYLAVNVDGGSLKIAEDSLKSTSNNIGIDKNRMYVVPGPGVKCLDSGLALSVDGNAIADSPAGLSIKPGPGVIVDKDGISLNVGSGLDVSNGQLTLNVGNGLEIKENKLTIKLADKSGLKYDGNGLKIFLSTDSGNCLTYNKGGLLSLSDAAQKRLHEARTGTFQKALSEACTNLSQVLTTNYKVPVAQSQDWVLPLKTMTHDAFLYAMDTASIRKSLLTWGEDEKKTISNLAITTAELVVTSGELASNPLNIKTQSGSMGPAKFLYAKTPRAVLSPVTDVPADGFSILLGRADKNGGGATDDKSGYITRNAVLVYVYTGPEDKKSICNIGWWDTRRMLSSQYSPDKDVAWHFFREAPSLDAKDIMMARDDLKAKVVLYQKGKDKPTYNNARVNVSSANELHWFYNDGDAEESKRAYDVTNLTTLYSDPGNTTENNQSLGGKAYSLWPAGYYAVFGAVDPKTGEMRSNSGGLSANAVMMLVSQGQNSVIGYWDLVTENLEWYDSEPDAHLYSAARKNTLEPVAGTLHLTLTKAATCVKSQSNNSKGAFSLESDDWSKTNVSISADNGDVTLLNAFAGEKTIIVVQAATRLRASKKITVSITQDK